MNQGAILQKLVEMTETQQKILESNNKILKELEEAKRENKMLRKIVKA